MRRFQVFTTLFRWILGCFGDRGDFLPLTGGYGRKPPPLLPLRHLLGNMFALIVSVLRFAVGRDQRAVGVYNRSAARHPIRRLAYPSICIRWSTTIPSLDCRLNHWLKSRVVISNIAISRYNQDERLHYFHLCILDLPQIQVNAGCSRRRLLWYSAYSSQCT